MKSLCSTLIQDTDFFMWITKGAAGWEGHFKHQTV